MLLSAPIEIGALIKRGTPIKIKGLLEFRFVGQHVIRGRIFT